MRLQNKKLATGHNLESPFLYLYSKVITHRLQMFGFVSFINIVIENCVAAALTLHTPRRRLSLECQDSRSLSRPTHDSRGKSRHSLKTATRIRNAH